MEDGKEGKGKKRVPMSLEEQLLAGSPRESKRSKTETSTEEKKGLQAPNGEFDGNPYFALDDASKKRVSVSQFKGKTLINLREYWEDKPTKKGITLSIEAFEKLKSLIPTLEAEIAKTAKK